MAGKSLQSAALPVQIFPAMEIMETSPEKPVWLARELSDELQCERGTQKDGKKNSTSRTKKKRWQGNRRTVTEDKTHQMLRVKLC